MLGVAKKFCLLSLLYKIFHAVKTTRYTDIYKQLTVMLYTGKLSRLCAKYTIHWKTFTVHQAVAIMYCTQLVIQGENFRDWLKICENRKGFPT